MPYAMQAFPPFGPAPVPSAWDAMRQSFGTVPWYLHLAAAYVGAVFLLLLVALVRPAA